MNVYPMKCRIRAAAGPTRVDIYDDIGGDWLGGGIGASDFAAQLASVKGPLDVHINSYGGDVDAGVAIGNTIRAYQGHKRTVVDGFACSIASVILQAGDERVALPGSMVMVHDAMTNCAGNEADLLKAAATARKHSNNIAALYASRAGGTAEQWRDIMKAETWYTADESVAVGLADRVGDEGAYLPDGVDVAALAAMVPGRIAAALRELPKAAASMAEQHGHPGQPCWDPDNDGDCDATPQGDTDHDFWSADGQQIKPVPGKPMDDALTERIRAVLREELIAAGLRNVKKPHGDVPYADPGYLDADGEQVSKSGKEGVARYPIDAEHVQAAWSYINQDKNAGQYTAEQLASIKSRIQAAMKEHGHEVSEDASNLSEAHILALFAGESIQLGAGKE